jgi:hypothetical protein
MNDNDLENELRSKAGRREEGYVPARLPMSLDEAASASPRSALLPRAALFAGVALAGGLAVAIVSGILSGPAPEVGGNGSPSAQASTSLPGVCAPADVALTAEAWGGAAGSRGTVVTVALAPGAVPCNLAMPARAEIVDANGLHLVKGATPTTTGSVLLGAPLSVDGSVTAGGSFQIGVAWSNWCQAQPAAPMTLFLGFGNQVPAPVGATGSVPASAAPPCNGSGASTLSLTDLQPAS